MESPTSLTDSDALIVADASTVINLNASGHAREILQAIPNRFVVADAVPAELEGGRRRGRRDADQLNELLAAGFVEIVRLGDVGAQQFEELVVGRAALTLDDGEAATIAYAVEHQGIALIDERKANRICGERYPDLRVGCTVDLFAHPAVQRTLGKSTLAESIVNALRDARMRVLSRHMDWVVKLIGPNQAALCNSLPRSARISSISAPK